MPARSKAQQRLMAMCEHGVKLDACPKHMTKSQMLDYARTPRKGLPERAKKGAMMSARSEARNKNSRGG